MTLKIERVADGVYCASDPSKEWFLSTGKGRPPKIGVCSDDVFFCYNDQGFLEIYSHSAQSRISNTFVGHSHRSSGTARPLDNWIEPSPDNRHLLIFQDSNEPFARKLSVVDVIDGQIVAFHDNLPAGSVWDSRIDTHGNIITSVRGVYKGDVPTRQTLDKGGEIKVGLMKVHPQKGMTDLEVISAPDFGEFSAPSKTGRFWLRGDPTTIPMQTFKIPVQKRKLFGKKTEDKTYFGSTVQLWQSFPLKFIRTATINWCERSMMPDSGRQGSTARKREKLGLQPVHGEMFERLSLLLSNSGLGPLETLSHDVIENNFQDVWNEVEDYTYPCPIISYSGRYKNELTHYRNFHWVGDEGFYNDTSFVHVDGETSPKLFVADALKDPERPPIGQNLKKQNVNYLPDGTIRINIYDSDDFVTIDPRNIELDLPIRQIKENEVIARGKLDKTKKDDRAERAKKFLEERMTFTVPVESLQSKDCIAAIAHLTDQLSDDLAARAFEKRIKVVFKHGRKNIGEDAFFEHVQKNCPEAVPALKALIRKHNEVTSEWDHLYSYKSDGREFLGSAARALGILDPSSMTEMRLFAERIDSSHQYDFCRETLPAIIKAHGLTKDVMGLLIWVILFRSGNAVSPEVIWTDFGLRDALKSQLSFEDAVAFFREVLASETDLSLDELAAGDFMGSVVECLTEQNDPWTKKFFQAI